MNETRRHTNQLLQNILPLHVAKYFLEQDRQAEVRQLYLLSTSYIRNGIPGILMLDIPTKPILEIRTHTLPMLELPLLTIIM